MHAEQYRHDLWMVKFKHLKEFKAKNGHCDVPSRFKENPTLGKWCQHQRRNYKLFQSGARYSITKERIILLESVGFRWSVDNRRRKKAGTTTTANANASVKATTRSAAASSNDEAKGKNSEEDQQEIKVEEETQEGPSWMTQLEELKRYKEKHGDCKVDINYDKANPGSCLGWYVGRMRQEYRLLKRGKPSMLKREQVDLLNEIGFDWEFSKNQTTSWEDKFEELLKFKAKHGHCLVPIKLPFLGSWVKRQRREYRLFMQAAKEHSDKMRGDKKQGTDDEEILVDEDFKVSGLGINQSKIDKLQSVGFAWSCEHRRPIL